MFPWVTSTKSVTLPSTAPYLALRVWHLATTGHRLAARLESTDGGAWGVTRGCC